MTPHEIFLLLLVLGLFGGILSGIPAMLAIAGVPLLMALLGSLTGVFDLTFLKFFPARVFGVMSNPLLIAVPLFVLMGVLLEKSRLAENMLDVLGRMLGGSSRGMALSVLAFSAIIAASTGIVGATVVMLVLISLPAMLEAGEPGHVVNTSSGNGGIAPLPTTAVYATSKAAVTAFTEVLYGQLHAVNADIGVSVLFPGPNVLKTGLLESSHEFLQNGSLRRGPAGVPIHLGRP